MRVLVVGTGSIGRRHISNLSSLGVDVSAFSYRAAEGTMGASQLGVPVLTDLANALNGDFDAVVVANRTDLHMEVALLAARGKKHLFLEKPLSLSLDHCDDLMTLAEDNDLVVESGFMLRLHPNLVWIKRYLEKGSLGSLLYLRAAVGQWLPDWRPNTDYRGCYSAFRSMGGGVIFDLIHDLDLVRWLAGPVVEVSSMIRHVERLDIETEAIAQIGLRLQSDVLAQVHLDYVRPHYGRTLEIVGTLGILCWDYTAGTVLLIRGDGSREVVHRVPEGFERNTMFIEYMEYFLRRIETPGLEPVSSLVDGIESLRIALACHLSARERRFIVLKEKFFNRK